MYNTSQCSRGIPNKSDSEQKQDNFYYSSPKAATDMGVSSSESHDLTAFYEMLSASFGVLSQNTGFYPSLDRIIETMLGPLNLGPGGGSYNEPISCLHRCFKFFMNLCLEMILVDIIGCDNKEIINPYGDNIEFIVVAPNKDTIFGDQFGKSDQF